MFFSVSTFILTISKTLQKANFKHKSFAKAILELKLIRTKADETAMTTHIVYLWFKRLPFVVAIMGAVVVVVAVVAVVVVAVVVVVVGSFVVVVVADVGTGKHIILWVLLQVLRGCLKKK